MPSLMLLSCMAGTSSWGQKQEEWRSKRIEDVEVEIIKERHITLPKANRNFDKISPHAYQSAEPTLTYKVKNIDFTPPIYNIFVRPMKLKQESILKTYGNFLSVGFGNYISPYLEAYFNTKRSEKRFYGAHIYHRSAAIGPVDENNSATFDTQVKGFGALYGNIISSSAHVSYENRAGYFYGYTPGLQVRRDTIQQAYHVMEIGGAISNTNTSRFNFLLNTNFSHLFDHYDATESELSVQFNSNYASSEKSIISFSSDYFLMVRQDVAQKSNLRHLLKLKPAFEFSPIEKMTLTLGANAIIENDTIQDQSFHIYPNVILNYRIFTDLNAYTSIKGDFDKISLHKLALNNFWINSNIDIFHTNMSYEFLIGLQGKIGKRTSLEVGFSRVDLKSLYMYQNSTEDRAKFDVLYDDVERVNFFAVARYEKNKKIIITFRGDYFQYTAKHHAQPWHKPKYRLTLNSFFDLYKKISVSVDFIGQGGMYRFDTQLSKALKLDPALDLNLKVNYAVSRPFSIFMKLENILSNEYPIYSNYKVRGFQLLAGINWSF